jgi:hypothetical protein
MHGSSMSWGEEAPVQSLGPLHVHFEGDHAPSEEVDPNDFPGGNEDRWPFVVAPCPGVPIAPDALYFRDGELVHTLGRLIWFESNGGHMIIQDTQDSHGPRDPESVHWAIVDLRDDVGSAHQNLFCMQNVMDGHREQVKEREIVQEMSVCLQSLEHRFKMFILDEWAPFQSTIIQSLTTVSFVGQACLRLHAAYQPPPSSITARLDVVCAKLEGLRVSLDSPQSSGGPSSSVPSLVSISSSSSQSSSPLHVQVHSGRWRQLSPIRSDGGQVSEDPLQQEDLGD